MPTSSEIVNAAVRIVERRIEELKQENAELRERVRRLEEAFTMAHQQNKKND